MVSRRSFLKALSALALPASAVAGLLRFQPEEVEIETANGIQYEYGLVEVGTEESVFCAVERPTYGWVRNHGESPIILTDGTGFITKIEPQQSMNIYPRDKVLARSVGGPSELEYLEYLICH